jgi:hypothetical protein
MSQEEEAIQPKTLRQERIRELGIVSALVPLSCPSIHQTHINYLKLEMLA